MLTTWPIPYSGSRCPPAVLEKAKGRRHSILAFNDASFQNKIHPFCLTYWDWPLVTNMQTNLILSSGLRSTDHWGAVRTIHDCWWRLASFVHSGQCHTHSATTQKGAVCHDRIPLLEDPIWARSGQADPSWKARAPGKKGCEWSCDLLDEAPWHTKWGLGWGQVANRFQTLKV